MQSFIEDLPRPIPLVIRVIQQTISSYGEDEGPLRAAALAYQGLLSLFPFLLFLVFIGSQVFSFDEVQAALNNILVQAVPGRARFLQEVVRSTYESRGSIGLIGSVGLLWTASALFNNLEVSLNVIWGAPRRVVWRRRLWSLLLVILIGLLFILSVIMSALPVLPYLNETYLVRLRPDLWLGIILTILFFWVIYHWLPNCKVSWKAALSGAALSGLLWEGAKSIFRWYLSSELANYGAVYGTLASVIAVILWAYFTGIIIYIGAEFGAVLQHEFWNGEGDCQAESRQST